MPVRIFIRRSQWKQHNRPRSNRSVVPSTVCVYAVCFWSLCVSRVIFFAHANPLTLHTNNGLACVLRTYCFRLIVEGGGKRFAFRSGGKIVILQNTATVYTANGKQSRLPHTHTHELREKSVFGPEGSSRRQNYLSIRLVPSTAKMDRNQNDYRQKCES